MAQLCDNVGAGRARVHRHAHKTCDHGTVIGFDIFANVGQQQTRRGRRATGRARAWLGRNGRRGRRNDERSIHPRDRRSAMRSPYQVERRRKATPRCMLPTVQHDPADGIALLHQAVAVPDVREGQYAVDHRLHLAGLDQDERHVDVGISRVAGTGDAQPAQQ